MIILDKTNFWQKEITLKIYWNINYSIATKNIMENLFFLRTEIIILLISSVYAIYYILENLHLFFKKAWRVLKKNPKKNIQSKKPVHQASLIEQAQIPLAPDVNTRWESQHLSPEKKMKITDILRKEAIHYQRWEYTKAKNLIIEWLALDKYNRQLNLELCNIYNKEWDFKKSEYIYRELIEHQSEDFDLLKKLWFVLALQKKYKDSIRVYRDAYDKKPNDPGVVDILSDLTFEVEDYKWAILYTKQFLKEKPRDVEKLLLLSYAYENNWELNNALTYYNRVLEMQPYNSEALERVKIIEEKIKIESLS